MPAEAILPHISKEIEQAPELEIQQEYKGIYLVGVVGDPEKTPSKLTIDQLRRFAPDAEEIIIADCEVDPKGSLDTQFLVSESGMLMGMTYQDEKGRFVRIDHHIENEGTYRHISATNQAIERVKEIEKKTGKRYKDVIGDTPVFLTHTDADSILAALISRGIIPPKLRYGMAAIAADHTGEANRIADALMGIHRGRDIAFSHKILRKVEKRKPLGEKAQQLLSKRLEARENAKNLIPQFQNLGDNVYYGKFPEEVDGELLPGLIDDAAVIAVAFPMESPDEFPRYVVKLRAGKKFQEGYSLMQAGMETTGGRYDATSTKRKGGVIDPDAYLQTFIERWRKLTGMQNAAVTLELEQESGLTTIFSAN